MCVCVRLCVCVLNVSVAGVRHRKRLYAAFQNGMEQPSGILMNRELQVFKKYVKILGLVKSTSRMKDSRLSWAVKGYIAAVFVFECTESDLQSAQ